MNRVPLPAAALLLLTFTVLVAVAVVEARRSAGLRRHKREWIIPAQKLEENIDYTKKDFIAKIRSDSDDGTGNVHYSLKGVGASEYPYNLFVVNRDSGFVRITGILDRENIAMYNLSGTAVFTDGREAEKNIDLRIQVVDQNDNPPIFGAIKPGEVFERSPTDAFIMKLAATDADEPGNENSQIAYTIIDQQPPGESMFFIRDGELRVKRPTLDRELQDWYILTVKGTDLNGRPEGNTGTGTFSVKIMDVNDNPPTLEKDTYEGSIEENTENVEVMRFKADDMDMVNSPNWVCQYAIVKGNEDGYFSIETDPKTNEGVLMLKKSVDYENVKHLELGIAVANEAPPYNGEGGGGGGGGSSGGGGGAGGGGAGGGGAGGGGAGGSGAGGGGAGGSGTGGGAGGSSGGGAGGGGSGGWWFGGGGSTGIPMKTYPVKIAVKNQPEGPQFNPKVKAIPVSEGGDFQINKVIASYPAIDGDTLLKAENVRYAKGSDPDNWLTIDELTGDIKLNKMPDRESKFLVNGTYYAKVLCMTQDMPSKTATGMIAIQVEDVNDHCPTLTSNVQTMCMTAAAVTVTAVDKDVFPNGAPFTFAIIPEGTEGVWVVEHLNDTATILKSQNYLWPGSYAVVMEIRDQKGHACPDLQKLKVDVCTCVDKGKACATRGAKGSTGAALGPAALGLLFLGLLMLLLIPLLLLFCNCGGAGGLPGGFTEMPFDAKAQLISYHTEGQGENTEVPLLNTPVLITTENTGMDGGAGPFQNSSSTIGGGFYQPGGPMEMGYMNGRGIIGHKRGGAFYSEFESREGGGVYESMALPDHYLEEYYSQKAHSAAENHVQKDSMLVYDYEGQGSPVGSMGCCSLLESDNDLQFLNDLGPKFKTLAEVCHGERFQTEVSAPPPPRPVISMPTAASSVTTNVASRVVSAAPFPVPVPVPAPAPAPAPAPPPAPAQVTHVNRAVVRESDRSATLRQDMVGGSQGQTFLLQQPQPVYYTTTQPMMQPVMPQMHYVVEQQVPNMQGMIMVNGPPSGSAQGLVLQGQRVVTGTQALGRGEGGMVLLERSGAGGHGGLEGGLIHMGNMSGSQGMMVVDGPVMLQGGQILQGGPVLQGGQLVQGGQVLQGGQAWLQQGGSLQRGGLSGSQSMLVMEGQGGSSGGSGVQKGQGGVSGLSQGSMQRSGLSGSHRVLYTTEQSSATESSAGSQSGIVGLNGSSSRVSIGPASSSHKVVIEKRVVTNQSTSK